MQAKHIKGTISLCAALIAGVALLAASGAGAAKPRAVTKIDVSTKAAVVHYLRSIHVNPKGAVIQRGARNYAGPNCPGKRWTCASMKHTVVQIAKRGGQNRFVCKSSKCVVVQISGASHGVYVSGRRLASTAAPNKGGNSGVCLKNGSGSPTGSGQSCTIIQSGSGPNMAVVWENSQKVAGLTTSLTFTAVITQTATGGLVSQGNKACVTQNINLDGSTTGTKAKPVTVALEAHQSVSITQDSSGSGPNTAANAAVLSGTTAICDTNNTLGQNQTLTSTVNGTASITQNENASPNDANVALDIKQNQGDGFKHSASGLNKVAFKQTNSLTAIANSPAGATQIQSSDVTGGILAAVNQDSRNLSTAIAVQEETQCEDAAASGLQACSQTADTPGIPLTQKQYGPAGLAKSAITRHGRHFHVLRKAPGDSSQTGNTGCTPTCNSFTITQTSKQFNDTNSIQKNGIAGGITTSGTGTVTQNTLIQGTPKKNVQQEAGEGDETTVTGNMDCGGSVCTKNLSAPEITAHPTDPATYGSTSFSFENVDPTVSFLCKLDGGSFGACTSVTPPNPNGTASSGTQTYSNLPSGSHTFSVETQDPDNGNVSAAATFTWVITPPDPTITSDPADPSSFTPVSFTLNDADPTALFKCKFDSEVAFTSCTSPVIYSALDPGSHTLTVEATDQTGTHESTGVATSTWTASIVFDGSPGTGIPLSALGPYTMTAFGADPQTVGTGVPGVNDPAGSITFSTSLKHDKIGNGWNTWSNGYTGDVYDTCFTQSGPSCAATDPSQVTIMLPAGTQAFYFYAEPNNLTTFHVTATAQDGTTSAPVDVIGNGGAKYFGFYGRGGSNIASIAISADDPLGFAVGEFGISVDAP